MRISTSFCARMTDSKKMQIILVYRPVVFLTKTNSRTGLHFKAISRAYSVREDSVTRWTARVSVEHVLVSLSDTIWETERDRGELETYVLDLEKVFTEQLCIERRRAASRHSGAQRTASHITSSVKGSRSPRRGLYFPPSRSRSPTARMIVTEP